MSRHRVRIDDDTMRLFTEFWQRATGQRLVIIPTPPRPKRVVIPFDPSRRRARQTNGGRP